MSAEAAAFAADAWVSLCAALGALVVLSHLPAMAFSRAVSARLRVVLWLTILFASMRVGHWLDLGWLFSAVTNVSAAALPLAALLLSEGLLRRHAPRGLKLATAGGGIAFALWGMLQIHALEFWRLAGLMAFQLGAFAALASVVIRRDRADLSAEENATIDRMALSFVLILPFVASDYLRAGPVDLPVRLGGLAVLALCWISIGAHRAGLGTADILRSFAAVASVCVALTGLLSLFVVLDLRTATQIFAVLMAAIMLLAIWQAAIALSFEDRQIAALRHMAEAKGAGPEAGFALVKAAAGAPDAILLGEADLPDMDLGALRQRFHNAPVAQAGPDADEQIAWLLSRFDASHAVALSTAPLRLALLDHPAIATSDRNLDGLRAIQRLAAALTAQETASD